MPTTAIIVPCRLESTRFPRKLLHPIRGKPLVLWVAERIAAQAPELPLFFAVDDALLAAPLRAAGFQVLMTDPRHASGTDRLAEANRTVCASHVINVQADEPLVTGAQIRALAGLIAGDAPMATLATPFRTAADFLNPNQVKVVFAGDGRARPLGAPSTTAAGPAVPPYLGGLALTFSRAPIPFARDRAGAVDDAWVRTNPCFKHLGLYAYHADLLEKFSAMPPGRYEQIEKLEQLRVLENGHAILVGVTEDPSIGVDTSEDALRFEQSLVSLEGPLEIYNGKLSLRIPLAAGGAKLAPLASGIGEIEGEYLNVTIQPWLAEKLRIAAGSLVVVDNCNGKFTITRSAKNDAPAP